MQSLSCILTYRWDAEDWSDVVSCSASCGTSGLQQRPVQCVTDNRGQTKAVEPYYCNQRTLPIYIQPCNRFPCTTPEYLPSTPLVSTTTKGDGVIGVRTGSDWSPSSITTPKTTNKDSKTNNGPQSTTRSNNSTTLLEIFSSTTLPDVRGNTAGANSRLPLEVNRLEEVPVRGGSSTDGMNVKESTRASMLKNEATQSESVSSSTAGKFSLEEEEEELFLFSRELKETTPGIGTS